MPFAWGSGTPIDCEEWTHGVNHSLKPPDEASKRGDIYETCSELWVAGDSHRVQKLALQLSSPSTKGCQWQFTTPSAKDAEQLAEKIRGFGVDACTVKGDLSNPEEFTKIISKASSKIGPILHLVNNASKFEHDDLESFDDKSWNQHMDVNSKAPLMLTRELLHNLPEKMTGSVVNILDQKIAAPNPDHISYTASRFALLGITEALARGLAPKLRINAVAPGHTLASPDQTEAGFNRAQSESPLGYGPFPR